MMKKCPECGKDFVNTTFMLKDGKMHKVYQHAGSRCTTEFTTGAIEKPTPYLVDKVVVKDSVESQPLLTMLSKYCKTVWVETAWIEPSCPDIYFPSANLAIKRYSVPEYYTKGIVNKVAGKPEIVIDLEKLLLHHDHVVGIVSGLYSAHVTEIIDTYSGELNLKLRQLIGFEATLKAGLDIDAFFNVENDGMLAYWATKYASGLVKSKKKRSGTPVKPIQK